LGTFIAELTSWRVTFAVVAAIAALAAIGIAILIPELARSSVVTVQMLGRMVRQSAILAILATTLLSLAGEFVVYTYIAPLTALLTHGGGSVLAIILFFFGLASVVGNALGGASSDHFGAKCTIVVSLVFLTVAMLVLWVLSFAAVTIMTIVLATLAAVIWGVTGWSFVTPLQSQLLTAAPDQAGVALALNNSALNLGTALGGAVGGLIVGSQLGFLPLCGALFIALGLLLHQSTVGRLMPSSKPLVPSSIASTAVGSEETERASR
jgi:predicted MFS family arabinose efflux permease